MDFNQQTLVLAVTGGVAAYKACDLIRDLQRKGAGDIYPILTPSAEQFISPLTLQALSKQRSTSDPWAMADDGTPWHIALAQRAAAMLIFPATANTLAKLAHGLSDDLVSTTALTFTDKPVIIVPAMNTRMWDNPATQSNVEILKQRANITLVNPSEGLLACGETGGGHIASNDTVLQTLYKALHPNRNSLAGQHIVISAGGTQEPIDPVRCISNHSSGKMGLALADEAYAMGAAVTLVTAQHSPPERPYVVQITRSVQAMADALLKVQAEANTLFMSAAVSDFKVAEVAEQKLKKGQRESITLTLKPNLDILEQLGQQKPTGQTLVGFAAETQQGLAYAQDKLVRKNLDAIVLNDVSRRDIAFGSEQNEITLLQRDGTSINMAKAPKWHIARQLLLELCAQQSSLTSAVDIRELSPDPVH